MDDLKDHQTLHNIDADDLRDLLLGYLEQRVGARDTSYKIEKTMYRDYGPMTYYPCGYSVKVINIKLTQDTLRYPQKKLFQVSHEVVHLLDPVKGMASNLEEGFATWFSVHICERLIPQYLAKQYVLRDDCPYKKQFELVERVECPFNMVNKIRSGGHTMCNVPTEDLDIYANKKYTKKDLKFLLQRFNKTI